MRKELLGVATAMVLTVTSAASVFALGSYQGGVTSGTEGITVTKVTVNQSTVDDYADATTDEDKDAAISSAAAQYSVTLIGEAEKIATENGTTLTTEQYASLEKACKIIAEATLEAETTEADAASSTSYANKVIEILTASGDTTAIAAAEALKNSGSVVATDFYDLNGDNATANENGSYTVSLKTELPSNTKEVKILHYSVTRGEWEVLTGTYSNGVVTFDMEDFSPASIFTVLTDETTSTTTGTTTSTTTSTTTTSTSTTTTSPKTGVESTWMIYIAGAAVLLTISTYVVKKGKKVASES